MNITKVILVVVGIAMLIIIGDVTFLIYPTQQEKQIKAEQKVLFAKQMAEEKEKRAILEQQKKEARITAFFQMFETDPRTEKILLHSILGSVGTGSASILRKNGTLYFAAKTTLPEPKVKTFYEGWLTTVSPMSFQYLNLGNFIKRSDGSYVVTYTGTNTLEGKDTVSVTWEQVDDQKPEKQILEGTGK